MTAALWQWDLGKITGVKNWVLLTLPTPFLKSWLHISLFVTGYEANEDKVYKEPLLTDPDEPPPAPVMLAEPAPAAPVSLDCSKLAYTEYSEPGQPPRTGSLFLFPI